jgi:hypothetical protein
MQNLINNFYKGLINLFGSNNKERFYTITNLFFILTILIASFASLFHVRGFWLTTNEFFWATALAGATGVGIIGSMMASRYTAWTYVSFAIIIIMELFGNIYDAFKFIDITSENFIAWKQLVEPIFEMIYVMPKGESIPDVIYMRWIACIQGSFIPLLVAIVFHMWMKIRKSYIESTRVEKVAQNQNNGFPQITSANTPLIERRNNQEIVIPLNSGDFTSGIPEPLEIKFEEPAIIEQEFPIPEQEQESNLSLEESSPSGETITYPVDESEVEDNRTTEEKLEETLKELEEINKKKV